MSNKIKCTKAIAKEIAAGLMTGMCGHPVELSEEAKKIWAELEKGKFDLNRLDITDLTEEEKKKIKEDK